MDAAPTVIRVEPGAGRVRVDLRAGALIPRLVSADERDCAVALVAAGALLIAGDDVRIDVEVAPGCGLRLEDVGGTVAYGGDGLTSGWSVSVRVHEGGRLRWDALPFVVSAGADVLRTTDVELADGAVAHLRETLVLGRHGETGGRLRASTRVGLAGEPLLVEDLDIDGADPRPGILGRHRVLDTALILGRRVDAPRAMQLDGPGTMVRALGSAAHVATVESAWASWRTATTTEFATSL